MGQLSPAFSLAAGVGEDDSEALKGGWLARHVHTATNAIRRYAADVSAAASPDFTGARVKQKFVDYFAQRRLCAAATPNASFGGPR